MKYILAIVMIVWAGVASAQTHGTLILLVDVSSSMKQPELIMQMESYEKAMLQMPAVRFVNVEVVTFGDTPNLLSSGDHYAAAAGFRGFIDNIYTNRAMEGRGSTCMTAALQFIEAMIPRLENPVVLDISGDGEANCTNGDRSGLYASLNRLDDAGVTVNTLYIDNSSHHLHMHGPEHGKPPSARTHRHPFYQSLTRGGGFSMTAAGFEDFELALFEKLVLELAFLDE